MIASYKSRRCARLFVIFCINVFINNFISLLFRITILFLLSIYFTVVLIYRLNRESYLLIESYYLIATLNALLILFLSGLAAIDHPSPYATCPEASPHQVSG